MQGYWADLKAPDFGNLPEDTVAVLPLGATEQHGPHLPVSVDSDLVAAVLDRSLPLWSKDTNALILPALQITKSNEHAKHPGTLSVSARTLLATLDDIGASVARAGVNRLCMLNGHGGNTAVLEIACRELRITHGLITAHGSWFGFAQWNGIMDSGDLSHDQHGGDSETSPMLAAKPHLVDMAQARNFRSKSRDWQENGSWIGLTGQAMRPGWVIDDLNDFGACGDAAAATTAKGHALLDSAAQGFASFLRDFSKFDPAA
ncbi:creatinine amidohydrolase [Shimia isoporae]|uniref:Creatinine amidohydrolase n=1 Tax=Shimia isoporae TaxID=647720 RepID=A0A4R1N2T3_9RHOB|nr:creatininase family protein [Shimia isoporae]TCL00710.1 creatinine amidohydrolase [Shimia isoporae]